MISSILYCAGSRQKKNPIYGKIIFVDEIGQASPQTNFKCDICSNELVDAWRPARKLVLTKKTEVKYHF